MQSIPTIYAITLYTPGHLEISWEVFGKKSADIQSFRHSFTLSSFRPHPVPMIYILYTVLVEIKVDASTLWHSWLWSFKTRGTKLERFLHKNQHTQRKLLKFENWTNGELAKIRGFKVDCFDFPCIKLEKLVQIRCLGDGCLQFLGFWNFFVFFQFFPLF